MISQNVNSVYHHAHVHKFWHNDRHLTQASMKVYSS